MFNYFSFYFNLSIIEFSFVIKKNVEQLKHKVPLKLILSVKKISKMHIHDTFYKLLKLKS